MESSFGITINRIVPTSHIAELFTTFTCPFMDAIYTLRTNGSMTELLKVQCLDIDKEPLKGLNGTISKVPQAEPLKVQN